MTNLFKKIQELIHKLRDLIFVGTGNITSTAMSAIFWFFIASLMTTEDYGEISYVLSIGGIVGTLALIGAPDTITVFSAKGEKVQGSYFFIAIIGALVSSIVLLIFIEKIELSLYVIGYIIFTLAIADLLGKKKYKDYSKYLISQKILFIGISVLLFYIMGPKGIIFGFAFSFFPYVMRIYLGFKETKIQTSIIKSHLRFSLNNYAGDLAKAFSGHVDKLIIGPLLGFALLGNYAIGIQILMVLTLLPAIIFTYILPQEAGGNPSKKMKKIAIGIAVIIGILGSLLGPTALSTFLPKYIEAVDVIRIISFAVIPNTITMMYRSKFLSQNNSFPLMIAGIIYVVIQIICIFSLGIMYDVIGIASALLIAAISQAIFLFIIDNKYEKDMQQN